MNILSALKIKKLNMLNTCTSYYDFLNCAPNCLDPLSCSTVPRDPPSQLEFKRPPKVVRSGVQYFDVDDKAAQWYLDTRRSAAERKPCKRRFCFRFHVPIRHALHRTDKAATYALPGRRVSPEFLSLLRQHHARMRGLERLPRKYRSRKPNFSYYKYDAAGKSRHMRPGISTAAPVEFPCTNVNCIRHRVCSCPPKKESPPQAPLSQADSNPPVSHTKPRKTRYSPIGKEKADVLVKKGENGARDNPKARDSQHMFKLHRIYASNPSLMPPVANQDPPKPIASKSQPSMNPMEEMGSCPCSIEQPKTRVPPICDGKNVKPKRIRDPRCIEYENRPFFKAIKGTTYRSRNRNKKPRNFGKKNCCEDQSKTQADDQEDPPSENTFYSSVSNHQELGLEHRKRPDLHDQNDIEIPPNRQGNSLGYRGFIHRSEQQKLVDRGCAPVPKCKSKPPPYCYLWSAVDPDIRKAEKRRLAEHNWCQRQMFPDSKPYSYYWSTTNPDVRSQVKRRLREADSRRSCGVPRRSIQPPTCSEDYSDRSEGICTCSRSTLHPFFEITSSDSFDHHNHLSCSRGKKLKSFGLGHSRNGKGAPNDCLLDWKEHNHSTSKMIRPRWPELISRKLFADSDRHLSKKPRLLPRLHAFAKRFLWSGSKAIEFKSNQSGSERPRPRSISIRKAKSKERETSDVDHQKDNQTAMCNETNSSDRKIIFRDQASIRDIRDPRDPKLWSKTVKKSVRAKRPRSSGSETITYRRSTNSSFGLPTCSRRSPRARSQAKKSPLCNERCSPDSGSHGSSHSSDCLTTCRVPHPLVSRAQREWEEHRKRKRAKVEECRPCTDYLLTSRPTEPQAPGIRRGVVTYRNYEFTTELSDPCVIEPKGKRFRFTEQYPMHRDKHYARSRSYRHCARCCDDSDDASRHKTPQGSRRMRGGIDFHIMEYEYSSRRPRYTAHTFPKSLPFKLESNERGHSPKPWNSSKHLFCFD
ncbi:uncharacterized protein LOC6549157 [Drosophila erecta]|uniref:Uncharacterized protein n=1 Tax=Drosophila erecta TaxID=7220 RepID=B3NRG5_DROER|nr:uncharacterized protein LOC6549157 [Drosophila erecta]EDV56117.1 uncharacterized protein Dere_GG20408 [Drosophila erecta]